MKMKFVFILCVILVICSSVEGWRRRRFRVRTRRWFSRRSQGGLKESACSSTCPSNYSPVCGSNGKTYGNKCTFNLAKCRVGKLSKSKSKRMTIAYSGKCKEQSKYKGACSSRCPSNYSPVCGSNGKTYGNKCIFNSAKCRVGKWSKTKSNRMIIAYSGKCKGQSKYKGKVCSRRCSKKYLPVCGSNGVMYSNICLLMVAKCQQKKYGKIGKRLYQVSQRKCKRVPKCPSFCRKKVSPICGSNGKSYRNMCYFNSARCQLKKFGQTITVAYYKKCYRKKNRGWIKGLRCRSKCYMYYSPVCGSNGKTYWNMCVFKAARCRINNRGRRLRYAYRGSYRRFWRLRYAYRGRCKRRRHAYRGKCKRGRRVYRGRCKRGRRVYRGRYKRRRPIMTVKTIINMSK